MIQDCFYFFLISFYSVAHILINTLSRLEFPLFYNEQILKYVQLAGFILFSTQEFASCSNGK
jgi:hypothetical protein